MNVTMLNEEGRQFTCDSEQLKKAYEEIEKKIKYDGWITVNDMMKILSKHARNPQ